VPPHVQSRALVAIDGVDGAGKTVFADELGLELAGRGRQTVRASIDDFLHPPDVRYRRGRSSPEGFWLDSYDYTRFEAEVLDPFRRSAASAILVVDGIFLHRDELVRNWDFSVFLRVTFDTAYARMSKRDGCPALPEHPANRRYLEGQRLYFAACQPWTRASMVIVNDDLAAPSVSSHGPVRETRHRDARP
jgi:uridine kinase